MLYQDKLANSLRIKMDKNGLTQKEVAEICKVNPSTVSRFINLSKHISYDYCIKIAKEMNLIEEEPVQLQNKLDFYKIKYIIATLFNIVFIGLALCQMLF